MCISRLHPKVFVYDPRHADDSFLSILEITYLTCARMGGIRLCVILSISRCRTFTEAITTARRQAGGGESSENKGMGH